jgi:integrase
LAEARRGTLPGTVRTGATFADAAAEWLRWCEHDRDCKPSTLSDYGNTARTLSRDLGGMRLEDITSRSLEEWVARLPCSNRTKQKYRVILHSIFRRAMKVWGLPRNPAADIERPRVRVADDIDAFSPGEVRALVRAAATPLDAALFLTAAVTGLRLGEMLALRWGDIDLTGQAVRVRRSYTLHGGLSTPKSGKVRSVPLVTEVASALARLGDREHWTGDDDLVFAGPLGGYQDGQALRKRYKAALKEAGLRELRLHDLRHTFGTLAIERASILQVKAWMGHADVQTTMRYLHHKSRRDEARLLEEAFAPSGPAPLSVRA